MIAYTMKPSDLTETANSQKELFLKKMVQEDIITKEQQDKMNNYCFVIAEKNYFGNIWDKIFWSTKEQEKDVNMIVVKIVR